MLPPPGGVGGGDGAGSGGGGGAGRLSYQNQPSEPRPRKRLPTGSSTAAADEAARQHAPAARAARDRRERCGMNEGSRQKVASQP